MRQKCYFPEFGGNSRPPAGGNPRDRRERGASVHVLALLGVAAAIVVTSAISRSGDPARVDDRPSARDAWTPLHPVTIVVDPSPPRVATGTLDESGSPITVRCGTCHATKPPNSSLRSSAELDLFHQGLEYRHGDLSCLACHDPTDYDRLRSASGDPIAFADRQALCAQCHGPTARDYEHGAHGGMTGHWDLARGPRTRLGCTQCHDPHAPAYPPMSRTFFTIDRFAEDSHDRR